MRGKKFELLSREEKISLMFDLINSFRIVKKPVETALFLQDLLTANEIRNLSIRLRIAKLLLAGKTHREIQNELKTSLTTITKVRYWLEKGGDGFKRVLEKLPLKWEMPNKLPRGPIEYHLPQVLLALTQYGVTKHQDKKVLEFIEGVESKRNLDRSLHKYFNEYYKEKALETKSLSRRKEFYKTIYRK